MKVTMDWGSELWDQFENVDKHLQHNIEYGDKYAKFVKERCSIEMEYAGKLRKLVKSFQPKRKEEDRNMFSTHKAFQSQLSELNDIAGQHETVAEEMMSNISKNAQTFYNELKIDKKKLYQDGRQHQNILEQHERMLEQTKKKFEKEWKECERSQAYFEKLDADSNVTKADVEKAKHIWTSKKDSVESAKTDYAAYLEKFNSEQSDHYQSIMPKLFESYRDCDERGILKFKELMITYAAIDQKVKPIIQKCLEGMDKAANAIDAKLDAGLVVEKLKSGFLPPTDKEFEDYTSPNHGKSNNEESSESQRNSLVIGKGAKGKGLSSWLFGPKKPSSLSNLKRHRSQDSEIPRSNSMNVYLTPTELEETSEERENPEANPQKSRALSFHTPSNNSNSGETSETLTEDNRSASLDLLAQSKPQQSSKSSTLTHLSGAEIRQSVTRNKRKLKAMFRMSKAPDTFPKVEVTGPISVDMSGSAASCDLLPISNPNIASENIYDEVSDGKGVESPDYSHLPPEQRKKKLQKLIDETRKELTKKEDGRKAILKMQDVYKANPALGDPSVLEGQIKQSTMDIDKIQVELNQYESWYSEATGTSHTSPSRGLHTTTSNTYANHQPTRQPLASETTTDSTKSSALQREQSFGDEFDEEIEPIGTCKALYDFDATSEGALSMKAGQQFQVLEKDNGDGWTRALYEDSEGYVPTSYIEVSLFS